mmetsp:Transcript_6698/g.15816  ORF Transcript_6698/g.15816 Transcript_6698/m.15816 type:complete len:84 (+) Transcript_6698:21-272(+)
MHRSDVFRSSPLKSRHGTNSVPGAMLCLISQSVADGLEVVAYLSSFAQGECLQVLVQPSPCTGNQGKAWMEVHVSEIDFFVSS